MAGLTQRLEKLETAARTTANKLVALSASTADRSSDRSIALSEVLTHVIVNEKLEKQTERLNVDTAGGASARPKATQKMLLSGDGDAVSITRDGAKLHPQKLSGLRLVSVESPERLASPTTGMKRPRTPSPGLIKRASVPGEEHRMMPKPKLTIKATIAQADDTLRCRVCQREETPGSLPDWQQARWLPAPLMVPGSFCGAVCYVHAIKSELAETTRVRHQAMAAEAAARRNAGKVLLGLSAP